MNELIKVTKSTLRGSFSAVYEADFCKSIFTLYHVFDIDTFCIRFHLSDLKSQRKFDPHVRNCSGTFCTCLHLNDFCQIHVLRIDLDEDVSKSHGIQIIKFCTERILN